MPKRAWKKENDQYLKENFSLLSHKEIAEKLGVSVGTVRNKCYQANLKRCEKRDWTEEETEYLKSKYRLHGDVEIAKLLTKKFGRNFTKKMVDAKMRRDKLKRSVEEVGRIIEKHLLKIQGLNNKAEVEVGTILVYYEKSKNRYTKWIKLKKGEKPVAFHRHVWEMANGEIPKGSFITFKDTDPLNCELENLELKTMSEIIARNRNHKKQLETNKKKPREALLKTKEIYLVIKKKREEYRKLEVRWTDLNSGKYLIGKLKTNEYHEVEKSMKDLKLEINNMKSDAFRIIPINSQFVAKKTVKDLYNQLINI